MYVFASLEAPDHKKDSVRFNLLEMLGYLHLQLGEMDVEGPVELMQWHEELQDRVCCNLQIN